MPMTYTLQDKHILNILDRYLHKFKNLKHGEYIFLMMHKAIVFKVINA